MNKLVTVKNSCYGLINMLTLELDNYLKNDAFSTYIYSQPYGNVWLIRHPGMTIGKIVVNEYMIITDISIFKDSMFIFNEGVCENLNDFIGLKLFLTN